MPASRDQLIAEHVPLVRAIAAQVRRKIGGCVDAADLVSLGSEALVDAATRFDERHGAQFSTFAHWRVRGAMLDGVRRMLGSAGRTALRVVPLDDAHHVADEAVRADDQLHDRRLGRGLPRALACLDARERQVIRKHYFEGKTLLEAGAELGLSKSWASRLHARAIRKLGELMQAGASK